MAKPIPYSQLPEAWRAKIEEALGPFPEGVDVTVRDPPEEWHPRIEDLFYWSLSAHIAFRDGFQRGGLTSALMAGTRSACEVNLGSIEQAKEAALVQGATEGHGA